MPSEPAIWAAQLRPQRLTITVAGRVFQRLVERSTREGRSMSNCAAFVLEQALFNPSQPSP